jgi:hypothetical protein
VSLITALSFNPRRRRPLPENEVRAMSYEISERKAEKLQVFADDEIRRYLLASIVIPSVKATVSLPATEASYTSHSSLPGVPAVVSKPIRTVTEDDD